MLLLLGAARLEAATSLTLAWDAVADPQVAGYIVHVGATPGVYSQNVDVGRTTSFVYQPVVAGQSYCFAVSSYYAGPVYSSNSAEVCDIQNLPPVLVAPGNQSSVVGQSAALQLQGSDPDGLPVTYSATSLPAGLSLQPSTGYISGTPTTAQTASVTARVSDGALTATSTFTWTVRPPIAFAGLTANRVAPQPTGVPITFTATATGGTTLYLYRWWLYDGASWQMLRDWTANASFTWTPSAVNANYLVHVWIKDSNSTTATWDVKGSMNFPTVAAPLQATMSADRAAPQFMGTPITFTATATGGTAPYQYRWWLYDGAGWQMLRDWTTNASFTWTPGTANANYLVHVWVNNANSPTTTSDAKSSMTFPIAVAPPLQATLSSERPSPQLRNTAITFTAAATGGKPPYQYRWWVWDGVSWKLLRDWTTYGSFTWTPTTPNPNYLVHVWVNSAGSPTTASDTTASLPFGIQ